MPPLSIEIQKNDIHFLSVSFSISKNYLFANVQTHDYTVKHRFNYFILCDSKYK